MARGSKDAYTDKQKRQAEHIEEGTRKKVRRTRKPNGSLGRPLTSRTVAARRVAADVPTTPRDGDASDGWAASAHARKTSSAV
jgi:hypothetical protein